MGSACALDEGFKIPPVKIFFSDFCVNFHSLCRMPICVFFITKLEQKKNQEE